MAHDLLNRAVGSTWASGTVSLRLADAFLEANLTNLTSTSPALVTQLFASWERVRVADCGSVALHAAAADIVSDNQPACEHVASTDAPTPPSPLGPTGPTPKGGPLLRCPYAIQKLRPSAHYKLKLELLLKPGGGRSSVSIPLQTLDVNTSIARK